MGESDWTAVDYAVKMQFATAQSFPHDLLALIRERMAAGHGGYPLTGSPEEVADGIERLVKAGFAGTTLSFVNYVEEFPYFAETVLPILEARAVRTTAGETFAARRAVVCNVTPTQLYGRLLRDLPGAEDARRRAQAYRYGPADMQIHIALSEPPRWRDPALGRVGLLHLTAGLDAVSRAVNEAGRGLLPAEPTIVVGQPALADPSCAPPGGSVLWLQLQELPSLIGGDAAGEIDTPADGWWTNAVAHAYARRVLGRLEGRILNLQSATAGLRVMGPHELERRNVNLVGGGPYSGACGLEQFHLSRPFAGARRKPAGVRRLHHIGASAHPGPGLGGVSGYLGAQAIG